MSPQKLLQILIAEDIFVSVNNGQLYLLPGVNPITSNILEEVKKYKSELIELISSLNDSAVKPISIQAEPRPEVYVTETSLAEQRMLFIDALSTLNGFYNIARAYTIKGAFDAAAFKKACIYLSQQADVLRSKYRTDTTFNEQPRRFIGKAENINFYVQNIPQDSDLNAVLQRDVNHSFQLDKEYPLRVVVYKLSNDEHIVLINIHHIAADGMSARTIISILSDAYQKAVNGILVPHQHKYEYTDYVASEKKWLTSNDFNLQRNYWHEQLNDLPVVHNLPLDFTRPAILTPVGCRYSFKLTAALSADIKALAQRERTSPFVICQAIFSVLLARYSGDTDIVFGTAAANRIPSDFIDTVGLFVNTLVLRHQIQDVSSFAEIISQAKDVNKNALSHQRYPFDLLVDELQPTRSLSVNPLVQIMLVMQDNQASQLKLHSLEVSNLDIQHSVSKFDLAVHLNFSDQPFSMEWEYNTALFTEQRIAAMAHHFQLLLVAAFENDSRPVGSIVLVPSHLDDIRKRQEKFSTFEAIHQQISHVTNVAPQATALLEDNAVITYQTLEQATNTLAIELKARGILPGQKVAVCMEKSVALVASMLAIWKAGAVYVPLDPHYPEERLSYMLQDSQAKILLVTDDSNPMAISNSGVPLFHVNIDSLCSSESFKVGFPSANATDPAYVIYTSGSTGQPKGVLVSHGSICFSLWANREVMHMQPGDVMPTVGSQAFGVSLLEILLPLISGASVKIITKANVADLKQLITTTNNSSVFHAVPSLMRLWLEDVKSHSSSYPNLRLLLVGGEPVAEELLRDIRRWRPELRVLVLYGMTECSVVCSSHEIVADCSIGFSLGKPHPNAYFRILNTYGQEQPQGVPGELHVGGLSLASSYLNLPQLTQEKFIEDPHAIGGKLYRSGDRVRARADGNYEFLGRVDNQVSLRGVRIELGEIESLCLRVDGVKQCVAHLVEVNAGEPSIALYYTLKVDAQQNNDIHQALVESLRSHLPEYMRPAHLIHLPLIPLNPNGKIDRKKLPLPQVIVECVAPKNSLEEKVLSIWQRVLKQENFGVTDNFFAIGGHSLMAARLVAQIRIEFSMEFPLSAVFECATVRLCAQYIEKKLAQSLVQRMSAQDVDSEEELFI